MTEIPKAQATDPPPAKSPPDHIYVPLALRQRVIQWVHSTPSSGHPGIAATVQLITNASGGQHCRPTRSPTFPHVLYPNLLTNLLPASYNLYQFHNTTGLT